MLFYGITLIMKEKSNASALTWDETRPHAGRRSVVLRPAFADKYREWNKKRYSAFVICRCERLSSGEKNKLSNFALALLLNLFF